MPYEEIDRLEIDIFSSEHRRKETFWHWEYNRITAKKDYCRNI